jgi:GNAT superfamily N-acetyltransferase
MPELKVSIEPTAVAEDIEFVEEALHRFNLAATGIPNAPNPVNVFLRTDAGEIKGGLIGSILAGWLNIDTLWVDQEYRRRGYAAELMSVAEAEARANGCKYAGLSTFEFQARPFYERLGYECFGVLNDHPLGHTHYYMYKRLI